MTGARPENPPPGQVRSLLELAARLVAARDALTTARDALASSPARSPALTALAEAVDGEARGVDELLAGVYRLVELAEDIWDDLDGPDPVPVGDRDRLRASLDRAVDNALNDLSRMAGTDAAGTAGDGTLDTRATVAAWAGATPDQVYSSIEHMSTADRRLLALAEPEAVGGTYGVPWAVRARANAVLVRPRCTANSWPGHRGARGSGDWRPWRDGTLVVVVGRSWGSPRSGVVG